MGLVSGFESAVLPLAIELGKCLFYLATISGVYLFIRGSASESIKKIKMSVVGYAMLKLISKFIILIDNITDNINF